jgi:hypothetical protein
VDTSALFRGIALAVLATLTFARIRMRGGKLANPLAWAPLAFLTGVGLWFLPTYVARVTPGVDLLSRPLGDWSQLLGVGVHKWLPFASAAIPMLLVGLGFSRPALRAPIGGVALGTAAYLLGTLATGYHRAPLGSVAGFLWFAVNSLVCLWIARIGLDRESEKG